LGSGSFFSNLLFGKNGQLEYVAEWDRFFAGSVVNENYWSSLVCSWTYPDVQDDGVALIETPSGTFQAVASIQAERTDEGIILCTYDEEEGDYTSCPDDYECENDVCVDNSGEAATGSMYKITWAVRAPADEAFTPDIDENGVAVTYNIIIGTDLGDDGSCGSDGSCVRIYEYMGDSSYPLKLINGESDGAVIAEWSVKDYNDVCIVWGSAPITINYWGAGEGDARPSKDDAGMGNLDSGGVQIGPVCSKIRDTTRGTVGLSEEAGSSYSTGSSSSASEVSHSSAEEGVVQNSI
ncbi:MAG: hypothetical protein ABIG93_00325, partial [archaeon]